MTRHITTVKSPQQKISVYIPPLFKKKRVKSSNYKWLYSLNISYINIITIYSLLCFAVLEAVTLMYSGVHVNLIEQLCILREDSLLLGTSQWIQNLELFILICLSSVSPLSLSSYLSAAISQQLSLSCLSVGSFFKASLWAILQVKLNTDHVYCFDIKVCTPALPAYQKLSRRIVYV